MYQFNPNLIVSYAEVLIGSQQRLEDTKPSLNQNLSTGALISNPTLLLGFIFQYLLDCQTSKEAIEKYQKERAEIDEIYKVNRIIKKLDVGDNLGLNLTPKKKFRLALYLYYHDDYDENAEEEIKKLLHLSKKKTDLIKG